MPSGPLSYVVMRGALEWPGPGRYALPLGTLAIAILASVLAAVGLFFVVSG